MDARSGAGAARPLRSRSGHLFGDVPSPYVYASPVPSFAYLSGGRLFVKLEGDEPREVESAFADAVIRRSASISKRNAWKTQGRGARFLLGMEGLPAELLEPKLNLPPIRHTGLARGRHPAELLYSLSTGVVSGLFAFSGGEEERLLHGNEWVVSEPACEPGGDRIACAARGKDGQTHIAVLAPGRTLEQVTAGDALDAAPAWVPGADRVVFESRAFGYDRAGRVVDLAPARLLAVDLAAGDVVTLLEEQGTNLTSPRVAPDGTLYFLRQPVPRAARVGSFFGVLLDVLLLPFRLLFAFFQYLNFFSLNYTGKPLLTAGSARARHADVKRAAIVGNLAAAAGEARDGEEPQLPENWQLVARDAAGAERVLARRVLAFDLYPDGAVVYTDGRRVRHRAPNGTETLLGTYDDVGEVLALEPSAPEA